MQDQPGIPEEHVGPTRKAYVGRDVIVSFDGERCQHAAECVRGAPAVFDTQRRPWIAPDGASADEVIAVVGRCPSGALRVSRVA
ncbi:MAG: (4Fe-4S)-binding protein [Solirubrobacteraceae bacterium]|nr:(4Fe-4S)-binding protein [Solirubrobacteraceae bacterium]